MSLRALLPVLAALLVFGCSPTNPQPVEPEPLQPNDAAAPACLQAEQNLIKLQCKDSTGRLLGGPNLHNETFHDICQNAIANHVNINPTCLAGVKSCSEVNSCPR